MSKPRTTKQMVEEQFAKGKKVIVIRDKGGAVDKYTPKDKVGVVNVGRVK